MTRIRSKPPSKFGSNPPPFDYCILAGGQSRRMGENKAQIRLAGKTLLERAQDIAAALGITACVIDRDAVAARGPVSGILTALMQTRADRVVIAAVDMPLVTPQWILELNQSLAPPHRAALTRVKDRPGFPVIVARTGMAATSKVWEENGDVSLKALAARWEASYLDAPNSQEWQFSNVNRPADLAETERRLHDHAKLLNDR